MSAKHTPGPWRWVGVPGESYLIAGDIPDDGCESDVAVMGYASHEGLWLSSCFGRKGEDIANAVLIAAAPELLEALEAVMHDFDDLDMVPSNEPGRKTTAFELACAAIAKAKGE